jgi:hypothetical protein
LSKQHSFRSHVLFISDGFDSSELLWKTAGPGLKEILHYDREFPPHFRKVVWVLQCHTLRTGKVGQNYFHNSVPFMAKAWSKAKIKV